MGEPEIIVVIPAFELSRALEASRYTLASHAPPSPKFDFRFKDSQAAESA